MEIMTHMNGEIVKNHTDALAEALDFTSVTHEGNYIFKGCYGSVTAIIKTEPVDESEETIRILKITTDPDARQKLEILYHLIRKNEIGESFVELPISSRNYEILAREVAEEKLEQDQIKLYIKETLENIVKLQGYEELGTYTINFKLSV